MKPYAIELACTDTMSLFARKNSDGIISWTRDPDRALRFDTVEQAQSFAARNMSATVRTPKLLCAS